MVRHLASKTGIIALASLAVSSSAAARILDPATDFCTTVSMDPDLAAGLGFADNVVSNLSIWLIMPLRDALRSVDRVERPIERFHYEPWKVPACSSGKAVTVRIRYSGRGESDPITVRTEIRAPGRPVATSLRIISIAQEIASGRVMPNTITDTRQTVISNSIKSEAKAAVDWILRGRRRAV
jgi:hypothetical protein